ncbi:hypothetical protein EYF80_063019 [Liparis tanakae]|uniref:Uncharacterized protein n=1 Tax=Liparis tanakae TaxID=230148 RepID=A0A4Z2EEC0_9TELE|nr:hypothetical protein EYF80_063019 [Liparis tanakae]
MTSCRTVQAVASRQERRPTPREDGSASLGLLLLRAATFLLTDGRRVHGS